MRTHIVRAKLMFDKRTTRDIEIPSDENLYALAAAIVDSFGFDFDHAFGFYDQLGPNFYDSPVRYELFVDMGADDDWGDPTRRPKARSVKRTKISRALTEPKQKMQFVFDYGDEWCFEIEVRGFGETAKGQAYPRVLATKGASPEQYPAWDDDEFEDGDE